MTGAYTQNRYTRYVMVQKFGKDKHRKRHGHGDSEMRLEETLDGCIGATEF